MVELSYSRTPLLCLTLLHAAVPYLEDDEPKRKPVLYEELRSKNRENYEVTLTQKAETLLKPQSEAAAPPKKDGECLSANQDNQASLFRIEAAQ